MPFVMVIVVLFLVFVAVRGGLYEVWKATSTPSGQPGAACRAGINADNIRRAVFAILGFMAGAAASTSPLGSVRLPQSPAAATSF